MSETLSISKENALKAFKGADINGKSLLSNLLGKDMFNQKITDRVTTFDDACQVTGTDPLYKGFTEGSPDTIAYQKLKIIAEALNEGWRPNWNNGKQYKYYPYFDMRAGFGFAGSGCGDGGTAVGSRLCFHSEELAAYAGKQFLSIYKAYLTFSDHA